ncbi:hypothetical protein [Crocinitomix catalasitica]|uniref:hypothetical protein n=1 Tax=Crocinitomix catalasitica TaxID=184607 RepID=UPI00048433D8|nr:hypothetical protein [Crocinitomix catalasitica]
MNNRLTKLKKKQQFVKIYISDADDVAITHFSGIVLDHNKDFVMMLDFHDFRSDGYVVIRKKDIYEIKRTKNEKFLQEIMEKEGILKESFKHLKTISLSTMERMFKQLKEKGLPIIIERRYKDEDIFQIGPIDSIEKKVVRIRYFNARGEYDHKPVRSNFKTITFFRVGDLYSELSHKYARIVK